MIGWGPPGHHQSQAETFIRPWLKIRHQSSAKDESTPPQDQLSTPPEQSSPAPEPGVFEVAVLPLQNTPLFPGTVVPLRPVVRARWRPGRGALATEEKLLACISVRPEKGQETRRRSLTLRLSARL